MSEQKPPEPPKPPETPEQATPPEQHMSKEQRAELRALGTTRLAADDADALGGICTDMAAAMREKANAIRSHDARTDILAAHKFNEAARIFKASLAHVDRSHRRYLESNTDVGAAEAEEED